MKANSKINLSGVAETLFIPLWARAEETNHPNPIIKDEKACEIISSIEYDCAKFKNAWISQVGVAVRTMLLDRAVNKFIRQNQDAVIVNIGAGLDTRFNRVDNGKILWYDIDLPEVIDLRKMFFVESQRHKMIGRSVLDYSWIEKIEYNERPLLFIVEGLLMYFEKAEVMEFMIDLADVYPKAEMFFEILGPIIARNGSRHDSVGKTDAQFKWGESDGRKVADFYYKIRFIEQWNYFDYHKTRWRWLSLFALFPWIKKRLNNHIVHVRFD